MPRSERSPLLLAGLPAAGVAVLRTRVVAAKAAAAFFVGVVPANVKMAIDWRHRPAPQRTAALARLPLQVPLVLWARGVARNGKGLS
ncbi:hypothetical protein [Streptomyces sp. NPDC002676]